jgi:nucleoside-diphosphate-sugar epimerase
MRLLITGASGFLGRAIVRAALTAGHRPIAMVRPSVDVSLFGWSDDVEVLRGDLRQTGDWSRALGQVEAVVHAAAATSGDLPQQVAGTVLTTENLLRALDLPNLRRFVHVSSFSVYDFSAPNRKAKLIESGPLEKDVGARDAYTMTKLAQERLVKESCETSGCSLVIIRPGVIFGPGRDWDHGRAVRVGSFDVIFSPGVKFRLTFVDNCAEAVIAAVTASVETGSVVNIVDDELPTHAEYHRLCRKAGAKVGFPLYVPWPVVATVGMVIKGFNQIVFSGRAKLPELLAFKRQRVRWGPTKYNNRRAHELLGWSPRIGLKEAVRRTFEGEDRFQGPPPG